MKPLRRLLAALVLLTCNANAQVLHKCVSGNEAVSWQSLPCPQGMRMTRSVAYTPEASSPMPASIPALVRRPHAARMAAGYRVSARMNHSKHDVCAKAREHREATLERVGLKRNYDLLSKLDADVRRVCR